MMNNQTKSLSVRYRTDGGFDKWMEDCNFLTNDEAIKALEVNTRTWFRWKANGVPKGWMGDWLIRRMVEIQQRRAHLTKTKINKLHT
jgi:hypothetical protein